MDAKGAIDVINQNYRVCIDYGLINNIPFFCTCGVGFDAFVSLKFADSGKRGLLTYLENTLYESLTYQPETYEIENEEGTVKYEAFLIACGNASQWGNNAYIAPQASLTDGLMDVTIMEPFGVLESAQIAYQLVDRTITQNSRIKTLRCKDLVIRRASAGVIHVDGDPRDAEAEVRVSLVPKSIRMVVNVNKQPWQPPLLRMFNDLYTDMSTPFREAPNKIARINEEFLSMLRNKN
jgi:diacylglycerol kinase family enzyme